MVGQIEAQPVRDRLMQQDGLGAQVPGEPVEPVAPGDSGHCSSDASVSPCNKLVCAHRVSGMQKDEWRWI